MGIAILHFSNKPETNKHPLAAVQPRSQDRVFWGERQVPLAPAPTHDTEPPKTPEGMWVGQHGTSPITDPSSIQVCKLPGLRGSPNRCPETQSSECGCWGRGEAAPQAALRPSPSGTSQRPRQD